jgi:hypothetical protein
MRPLFAAGQLPRRSVGRELQGREGPSLAPEPGRPEPERPEPERPKPVRPEPERRAAGNDSVVGGRRGGRPVQAR